MIIAFGRIELPAKLLGSFPANSSCLSFSLRLVDKKRRSGTARSEPHQSKARKRMCVCANERGPMIECRKQTRNMDESKLWQSCSLLYVVRCIVPCCSARVCLLQERPLMNHSCVTWHMTHSYVTWLIHIWHYSFIHDMIYFYVTWVWFGIHKLARQLHQERTLMEVQ